MSLHKSAKSFKGEGQVWTKAVIEKIRASSAAVDTTYATKLESVEAHSRSNSEVKCVREYINEFCWVVIFLMAKEELKLPDFAACNDGSYAMSLDPEVGCKEKIEDHAFKVIFALIRMSASESNAPLMDEFLRFMHCKVVNDSYLEWTPIEQVAKRCSAHIYAFKMVWRAFRFIAGKLNLGYKDVKDYMSKECFNKVMSGNMNQDTPMIALFRLKQQATKFCHNYSSFRTVQDHDARDEIAAHIDDKYVSSLLIRMLYYTFIVDARNKMVDLFGDTTSDIANIVKGDYVFDVKDNPRDAYLTFVVRKGNAAGDQVSSAQMRENIKTMLIGRGQAEFRKFWEMHIELGQVIQATLEVCGSCRTTEFSNILFQNGSGGMKRSVWVLPTRRSACGTVSTMTFVRTKIKHDGNAKKVSDLLSVALPDSCLLIMLHIIVRQAINDAWSTVLPDEEEKPDPLQFLFLGKKGERQGSEEQTASLKSLISEAIRKLRSDGDLTDPRMTEISQAHLRHYFELTQSIVQDHLHNIQGGTALRMRTAFLNKTIQGHGYTVGEKYWDSGVYNDNLGLNHSQILDIFQFTSHFHKAMKLPDTIHGREEQLGVRFSGLQRSKSLAEAVGFDPSMTDEERLEQAKVFLNGDGLPILKLALNVNCSPGAIAWREEILMTVAWIMVRDFRFPEERRTVQDVYLNADMGRGKSVIPLFFALLPLELLQRDATHHATVLVSPNKGLCEQQVQACKNANIPVFTSNDNRQFLEHALTVFQKGGILVVVVDSLLKRCMNAVTQLIREGKLLCIWIDEGHEYILQRAFRSNTMDNINALSNEDIFQRVSFNLLSGTSEDVIFKKTCRLFGIDPIKVKRFSTPLSYAPCANIAFQAVKTKTYKEAVDEVVKLAIQNDSQGQQTLIGCLTCQMVEDVVKELGKEPNLKFIANSRQRREDSADLSKHLSRLQQFREGKQDMVLRSPKIVVSTFPLTGWNCQSLLHAACLGSHCLYDCAQFGARVARKSTMFGCCTFVTWDGWEDVMKRDPQGSEVGGTVRREEPSALERIDSVNLLFQGDCLRMVLGWTNRGMQSMRDCSYLQQTDHAVVRCQTCNLNATPSLRDIQMAARPVDTIGRIGNEFMLMKDKVYSHFKTLQQRKACVLCGEPSSTCRKSNCSLCWVFSSSSDGNW